MVKALAISLCSGNPTFAPSGWFMHGHVIVVSWFLQCMGYVPREGCMYFRGRSPRKYIQYEGGTYPMHCKNHETAVLYNRPRKATARC